MSYETNIDKFRFYREVQLWPLAKDLDFEGWLDNFDDEEDRKIASIILNNFIYIPESICDKLLEVAIGKCGYYFKSENQNWKHEDFIENCWYSYIPGEKPHSTDSGLVFLRKLKEKIMIPEERILSFEQLFHHLEVNYKTPQNVILVDDFVGSGEQCSNAWNHINSGSCNISLSVHASKYGHRIIYAPLIVNELGLKHIKTYCNNLEITYIYLLDNRYNLFNQNSCFWNGNEKLFLQWMNLVNKVVNKEKIPNTEGEKALDIYGFKKQGLAVSFSHGIPDACSAIFYWDSHTWQPLKKRPYKL